MGGCEERRGSHVRSGATVAGVVGELCLVRSGATVAGVVGELCLVRSGATVGRVVGELCLVRSVGPPSFFWAESSELVSCRRRTVSRKSSCNIPGAT